MRLGLVLALSAAPAAAQTFTVAPSGGDFTEIQAAIDAAPPGATVLVAAGQYDPFVLAKPLTILGEGSGVVQVGDWFAGPFASSRVVQIPAGTSARLSGLSFEARLCTGFFIPCLLSNLGYPLVVEGCAGVVALHDVVVDWSEAAVLAELADVGAALTVTDSALVLVDRARLGSSDAVPGWGIGATNSTLWISDSVVHGGHGLAYSFVDPSYFPGSSAAFLTDSVLYAARTEFWGGNPTYIGGFLGQDHATGGAGVRANGSVLKFAGAGLIAGLYITGFDPDLGLYEYADLVLTGGSYALADEGWTSFPSGFLADPSSTFHPTSATYPMLRFGDWSVQPGAATVLDFDGAPGSVVLPFASFDVGAPFALPGVDGAAALHPGSLVALPARVIGPQGYSSLPIAVPSGIGNLLVHAQAVATSPTGVLALSNPTSIAILE
ncbi:MAG TPA: hypothetical protein VJP77_01755 [Planctomycetota bacterium]|nr:hypothetical protein [Planctomycetota bacterium]